MSLGQGGGSRSADADVSEPSESEAGDSQSESPDSKSEQSLSRPHIKFGDLGRGSTTDTGERTLFGGSSVSECLGCSQEDLFSMRLDLRVICDSDPTAFPPCWDGGGFLAGLAVNGAAESPV